MVWRFVGEARFPFVSSPSVCFFGLDSVGSHPSLGTHFTQGEATVLAPESCYCTSVRFVWGGDVLPVRRGHQGVMMTDHRQSHVLHVYVSRVTSGIACHPLGSEVK